MTHHTENTAIEQVLEEISANGMQGLETAVSILINEAMKVERSRALGAEPWQRSDQRRGYANGYKPRSLKSRIGKLSLQVPQVRGGVPYYPSALERGLRSERALKLAIAEMYVQGISTRKVTEVMETLCGLEVTSAEVSRCASLLDEQLEQWRSRPLGHFPYLVLDARYENLRQDGTVRSCAVLIAAGVREDGKRGILGTSCTISEAEDIRNIFNVPDRQHAERLLELTVDKYRPSASRLANWMQTALPEGFTVFMLPQRHRRPMRTTNMLERVNQEVKRRTRVATLFPNEPSLLRLVSAVLMEISEEWEAGKIYLNLRELITH